MTTERGTTWRNPRTIVFDREPTTRAGVTKPGQRPRDKAKARAVKQARKANRR
jgi:hypothetical protein